MRIRGTIAMHGVLASLLALSIAACGGGGSPDLQASVATATPGLSPTAAVAATATPTPTPIPEPTVAPAETGKPGPEERLALGKLVFEETAGGIGCAACHGFDGRGKPELAAPPNRGATAEMIYGALQDRPQMSFITLTNEEIEAVAAYLQWLATQP